MEPEQQVAMMNEAQQNIGMDASSEVIITQHESMMIQNDIFDRFMDSCEKAKQPKLT